MKNAYIYTLSEGDRIRYIGKTEKNLKERLKRHLSECRKRKTKKEKWIWNLLKNGNTPVIEMLDIVPYSEWSFYETYWISQFKNWGFKLLNGTDGGEGSNGFKNKTHTIESKIKISNSVKKNIKPDTSGIKNPNSSLSDEQIKILREDYKNGLGYRKLNKKYNIPKSTIARAVKRSTYKNI